MIKYDRKWFKMSKLWHFKVLATEPLFWVRVPADAPYKNCRLESSLSIESSRGQAQFLFMRPDASRHKRVPVKLFTISWEKEQTSDSGIFASSKLPRAPFVTPPQLPSEASFVSKRNVYKIMRFDA